MTAKGFIPYRVKAANKSLFFALTFMISVLSVAGQSSDKKPVSNQSVLQKRITCDFQNTSIEQILKALTDKYKIRFTYVNNEIPLSNKVTVHIDNQILSKALDIIFRNQFISYQEIGSQVLLKKLEPAAPAVKTPKTVPKPIPPLDSITSDQVKDDKQKKRGSGFSFSFLSRKKRGFPSKAYEIPKPADSTAIARDSTKREQEKLKQESLQKTFRETKNLKKWSIGVFYSASATFRFLKGNDISVSQRNLAEKRSAGSSWGLSVAYNLSGSFYLRTGLGIIKFKEKGNYFLPKQYLPPPHKRPKDFQTDTSISYTNSYTFLSIPLVIGYSYGNKWFVSINTGIAPVFFLNSKTDYPSNDAALVTYPKDYAPNPALKPATPAPPKKVKDKIIADSNYYYNENLDLRNRNFNSVSLMYITSLEAGYRIQDQFAVSVSPVFNCMLTSIQRKESKTKDRPYSYGLSFALYYIF